MTEEEEYFTPDEVALKYKVTRKAVYQWVERGQLEAVRLGDGPKGTLRITRTALRKFVRPSKARPDDGE